MLELLKLAAQYSISNIKDERLYLLGAVGVRKDGRIVHARNDAVFDSYAREMLPYTYKRFPESHAEARLTKKLDFGATVYVARVMKGSGNLAISKPCSSCERKLRAFRVKKVYYTISSNEWGVIDLTDNVDSYYSSNKEFVCALN